MSRGSVLIFGILGILVVFGAAGCGAPEALKPLQVKSVDK